MGFHCSFHTCMDYDLVVIMLRFNAQGSPDYQVFLSLKVETNDATFHVTSHSTLHATAKLHRTCVSSPEFVERFSIECCKTKAN